MNLWKSNNIKDIKSFFVNGVKGVYGEGESEALFFITTQHFFGWDRKFYLLNPDKNLSESELLKVHFTVKRLIKNEPIQYILGETEFFGLKFHVNEHTLIPRPETEELVQWVIEDYKTSNFSSVLDIGTGSGCLAVAIAKNILVKVTAVDFSEKALEVAQKNSVINQVNIQFKKVDILQSKIPFEIDVIVSNPPYVGIEEKNTLMPYVLKEPLTALFPQGKDDLIFYKTILDKALKSNVKKVYFEINQNRKKSLEVYLNKLNIKTYQFKKDLSNNWRMLKVWFA